MQSPVEARIDEVDRRVADLGRTVDQRFDGLNHSIEQAIPRPLQLHRTRPRPRAPCTHPGD